MGVDYENNEYKVTAQYFTAQSGTDGDSGPSGSALYTETGSGISIANALSEISFNAGHPVMLGECQIFVIGGGLSGKPLDKILETFTNEYGSYPKVKICITDGKAEDVLKVKFKGESVSVHRLNRMLQAGEEEGYIPNSVLYAVMKDSQGALGCAFLPLVEVIDKVNDFTEGEKVINVTGGILFKDNVKNTAVNLDESTGILWLRNTSSEGSVTITQHNNPFLVNLFNMNTKIWTETVDNGNGNTETVIRVNCDASTGYTETHISNSTKELNREIKEASETAIIEKLTNALKITAIDNGIDVIQLADIIRNKNYLFWMEVKDDWQNNIKKLKFVVTANVEVSRFGAIW